MWYNIEDEIKKLKTRIEDVETRKNNSKKIFIEKLNTFSTLKSTENYHKKQEIIRSMDITMSNFQFTIDNFKKDLKILKEAKNVLEKHALTGV